MRQDEREAAIDASEHSCPRCGAERAVEQEYCLECGLRLPEATGTVTTLRRGWLRRLGWYPGDWVWAALLALAVAAGGAAVAIGVTRDGGASGGTTVVLTTSFPVRAPAAGGSPATATVVAAPPDPTTGLDPLPTTPAAAGPPGRAVWPAEFDGWTIVLISYPREDGFERPRATARRAANAGLPEVGVLDSSEFASLHPGYSVVFSGVYSSRADAEAAITSVRASGFGGAYVRQIAA